LLTYRLIQTDYDGATEIFRPVSVQFSDVNSEWIIYPNPFTESTVNVLANSLKPLSQVEIIVCDINGRELGKSRCTADTFGNIDTNLTIPNSPAGIYVLNVIDQNKTLRYKLVRK